MDAKAIKKSLSFLNKIFIVVVVFDILLCWHKGDTDLMMSSVYFLLGLVIARIFIQFEKQELATLCISYTLYFIGFYHVVVVGNHATCYFILIAIPIVGPLMLERNISRYLLFFSSFLLFPLCNYLSGFGLFDNYFFYYGLIPSFISVMYFSKILNEANEEKSLLIEQLKDKNEEILLYSNIMSHDLKAPLRSITGFSELLLKKHPEMSDGDKKLFTYIIDGVNSMRDLINDLLLYSKSNSEEIKLDTINLENLVDEVLATFKFELDDRQVEISKNELGSLLAHKDSLFLVLQNMISNSIKYQPKDENHIPKIKIQHLKEKLKDQIIISDNGIGLEISNKGEIFKPFKRLHSKRDYEGTGLGMSIVSKLIEKHNGIIKVDSEINKGTRFTIELPGAI